MILRNKKKSSYLLLVFLILVVLIKIPANFHTEIKDYIIQDKVVNKEIEKVIIKKIVDGDTIWVERKTESTKVRLIGIDTPESVHPDKSKNTADGEKASDYIKSVLSVGQVVYLQRDISETDRYGRLLRYVWLTNPNDVSDDKEIKSNMLNAIILKNGYATATAYEPDTMYEKLFYEIEKESKDAKKGLWK